MRGSDRRERRLNVLVRKDQRETVERLAAARRRPLAWTVRELLDLALAIEARRPGGEGLEARG